MRNTIVSGQLNKFGVDHQETEIFWTILVHQTYNQTVQCNRLTGASCTSHQQVRHFCKVTNNNITNQILTDGKHKVTLGVLECIRLQQGAQNNRCFNLVCYFDTNQVGADNWCMNKNIFRCFQTSFEVARVLRKVAHAGFFGQHFKSVLGYRWANNDIYRLNLDVENCQFAYNFQRCSLALFRAGIFYGTRLI